MLVGEYAVHPLAERHGVQAEVVLRQEAVERAVVIVASRVDPVVGLGQAEFLRRALQANVDAEVADAWLHGPEQAVVAVLLHHR